MFTTAIVAHLNRLPAAENLAHKVEAKHILYDDGQLGCERNHERAWTALAKAKTPWALVLEDDTEIEDGTQFRDQLHQALTTAPAPIVSLYLGTGHPTHLQKPMLRALTAADREQAHWIVGTSLAHAVAVAIQTPLIPSLIQWLPQQRRPWHPPPARRLPIDKAIQTWAAQHNHRIAYTVPSLVNHADGEPLVQHQYRNQRQPRRAHRVGARETWTGKAVTM